MLITLKWSRYLQKRREQKKRLEKDEKGEVVIAKSLIHLI